MDIQNYKLFFDNQRRKVILDEYFIVHPFNALCISYFTIKSKYVKKKMNHLHYYLLQGILQPRRFPADNGGFAGEPPVVAAQLTR